MNYEKQLILGLWVFLTLFLGAWGQWVDPPPKYDCPKRNLYPCRCLKGSEEGVYITCNNTNIASLAVGLRHVRTLIHTLTIEDCNIEKIYGDIFHLLTVRVLSIKDTPIKDISDHTFDGVIAESMEVRTYFHLT